MPTSPEDPAEEELRSLEAEVASKRERVAARLAGLRSQFSDVADWRAWYRQYYPAFLIGAFLAGWAIERVLRRPG
jgi:hypothetical protein